ncbi:hypothetical protein BDW60DRAFT_200289 [Aspergillus nidulans var. acristatus]|jgi:hypothetical protein
MTLPQTAQFINSLLLQISHHTTTQNAHPLGNNELEAQTQAQRRGYHRLTQAKSTSAFPTSQAANLKPLMLTLHCIFPNEFLLALDILDRGLVRRVRSHACSQQNTSTGIEDGKDEDEHATENQIQLKDSGQTTKEDFFFVTSASTISSTSKPPFTASQRPGDHQQAQRQRQAWQEKGYEVRLQAWNCTCPFFTISAFRDMAPEPSSPSSSSDQTVSADGDGNGKATHNRIGYENFSAGAGADTVDTNAYADAYSFGGTLALHQESAPPVCKHILACLLAVLCPGLGVNGRDEEGRFVTLDREEIAALCAG